MDEGDAGRAGSKDGKREMSRGMIAVIQARDGRGFVRGNKCYVVENNWILGVSEGKTNEI